MNIYLFAIQHISIAAITLAAIVLGAPAPAQAAEVSVSTQSASLVTDTAATINGRVSYSYKNVTVWFLYGTERDTLDTAGIATRKMGFYNEASFKLYLTDLTPSTTYYYKTVADGYGAEDLAYGETMSFTTRAPKESGSSSGGTTNTGNPPPSGTLSNASAITETPGIVTPTSAQLKGISVSNQNLSTDTWFEWGASSSLGMSTARKTVGSATASFDAMISDLRPGTTYYYRAVTQTTKGISQGAILSFTTRTEPTSSVGGSQSNTAKRTGSSHTEDDTNDRRTPSNLFGASVYGAGFFPETMPEWIILAIVLFMIVWVGNTMHNEHLRRVEEKKKKK